MGLRGVTAVAVIACGAARAGADVPPAADDDSPTYLELSVWAGDVSDSTYSGGGHVDGGLRVAGGLRLHACARDDGPQFELGLAVDAGFTIRGISPGVEASVDWPVGEGSWRLGLRGSAMTSTGHGSTRILPYQTLGVRAHHGGLSLGLDGVLFPRGAGDSPREVEVGVMGGVGFEGRPALYTALIGAGAALIIGGIVGLAFAFGNFS